MYPPAGILIRTNSRAEEMKGRTIPARTMLVIPVHLLHRHPLYLERPRDVRARTMDEFTSCRAGTSTICLFAAWRRPSQLYWTTLCCTGSTVAFGASGSGLYNPDWRFSTQCGTYIDHGCHHEGEASAQNYGSRAPQSGSRIGNSDFL